MYKISIAVPCGLTINYRYLVLLESPDSEVRGIIDIRNKGILPEWV